MRVVIWLSLTRAAHNLDGVLAQIPLPESNAANDWVWLKLNNVDLMLNTAYEADQRPPSSDPSRVGAHGDIVLFFGSPDIDGIFAHLRAQGIDVEEPKVAPYGMKQISLRDPARHIA